MQILDPLEIKYRAERLGLTRSALAKRHRRSLASISLAFKGKRPGLLGRIAQHVEKIEKRGSTSLPQSKVGS